MDTLAKRFRRTRTSMYRVINEIRAQRLLEQPLDYIPHPSFDDPAAEAEILGPMPDADEYEAQRRQMQRAQGRAAANWPRCTRCRC